MKILIVGEERMLAAGAALARACPSGAVVVHLVGELGAGKTTLVRGFMRGLGYHGPVKSPTYTLLESYELAGRRIHHFDLYRVTDPDELEYLGVRDCLGDGTVLLIEWPAQGGTRVPAADVVIEIAHIDGGRLLRARAVSAAGSDSVARFAAALQSDGDEPISHGEA